MRNRKTSNSQLRRDFLLLTRSTSIVLTRNQRRPVEDQVDFEESMTVRKDESSRARDDWTL